MLVLARNRGQWVDIGDDVRIYVVSVREGKVRLGIEAPVDMRILRREICGKPMGRHGGRKPDPQ